MFTTEPETFLSGRGSLLDCRTSLPFFLATTVLIKVIDVVIPSPTPPSDLVHSDIHPGPLPLLNLFSSSVRPVPFWYPFLF